MNKNYLLKMRCKPEKREVYDIIIEKLGQALINDSNKHNSTRVKHFIHNEVLQYFKVNRLSNDNFLKLKKILQNKLHNITATPLKQRNNQLKNRHTNRLGLNQSQVIPETRNQDMRPITKHQAYKNLSMSPPSGLSHPSSPISPLKVLFGRIPLY